MEYISFGGGPPSLALAILNANGFYRPRADFIIFADTGDEKTETYRLNEIYENYFIERGYAWIQTQSSEGPLSEYIKSRSVVIPIHTQKGLGRRQCTDQWKIRAIRQELKNRFGTSEGTVQLALTWDEALRMKDSKYKDTVNRFPLIESKTTRADCIQVIQMEGLPVPPWSACVYCPLQSDGAWRQLFGEHKVDVPKVLDIDNSLPDGKWLHWRKRRIETVYSDAQVSMFDPTQGGCESGYCFV